MAIVEMSDGTRKKFPGVVKNGRRYYARVRVGKTVRYLGDGHGFDTAEEAHAVYVAYRTAAKPSHAPRKPRKNNRTSTAEKMADYLQKRADGAPEEVISQDYATGDALDLGLPGPSGLHYLGFEVVPEVIGYGGAVWRKAVPVLLWARDCRVCGETVVPFKTSPGKFPDSIPATCPPCAVKETQAEVLSDVYEGPGVEDLI